MTHCPPKPRLLSFLFHPMLEGLKKPEGLFPHVAPWYVLGIFKSTLNCPYLGLNMLFLDAKEIYLYRN